jgi:hypothetical protein
MLCATPAFGFNGGDSMRIRKSAVLVCLWVCMGSHAWAQRSIESGGESIDPQKYRSRITQDRLNVYIRTPAYLMKNERYGEGMALANQWIGDFLTENRAMIEDMLRKPVLGGELEAAQSGDSQVDRGKMLAEFVKRSETELRAIERQALMDAELGRVIGNSRIQIWPVSAWMIVFNYKIAKMVNDVGAPVDQAKRVDFPVQLSVVVSPYQLITINKLTKKQRTERFYDVAFYIQLYGNFYLAGRKEEAAPVRMGAGVIWGPLERADALPGGVSLGGDSNDPMFEGGLFGAVSGSGTLPGLGRLLGIKKMGEGFWTNLLINLKLGAFMGRSRVGGDPMYPFAMVTLGKGANIASSLQLNAGINLSIQGFIRRVVPDLEREFLGGSAAGYGGYSTSNVSLGGKRYHMPLVTPRERQDSELLVTRTGWMLGRQDRVLMKPRPFQAINDLPSENDAALSEIKALLKVK